jgi:hypothetical protein
MLNDFLEGISLLDKVHIKKIGASLSGLDLHAITISAKKQHP